MSPNRGPLTHLPSCHLLSPIRKAFPEGRWTPKRGWGLGVLVFGARGLGFRGLVV